MGAPAAQLHSQLHGLKRKAAARRRQQPASANPDPAHAGEAPQHAATISQPPGAMRRGAACDAAPAAEEGCQRAGPFVRPAAAARGAAAASSGGASRSVEAVGTPLAHDACAASAGRHHAPGAATGARAAAAAGAAGWQHAVGARGRGDFAGQQQAFRVRRGDCEQERLRSRDGLNREGFRRDGARTQHAARGQGFDRAGGDGAGVLHVVRCAREFLADVRGQRLSNNVVASALQVASSVQVPCCRDGVRVST